MTSRWVYLALAVIFAFGYIQETVARSLDGLEIKDKFETVAALVPEPLAAGNNDRHKRSPKKHKKHGHGHVVVVHHHHGHYGHGHHHHHG